MGSGGRWHKGQDSRRWGGSQAGTWIYSVSQAEETACAEAQDRVRLCGNSRPLGRSRASQGDTEGGEGKAGEGRTNQGLWEDLALAASI